MEIQSPALRLTIHPEEHCFELASSSNPDLRLRSSFNAIIQNQRKPEHLLEKLAGNFQIESPTTTDPEIGPCQQVGFSFPTTQPGISVTARFFLMQPGPFVGVQMTIANNSESSIQLKQITLLAVEAGDLQIGNNGCSNPTFYSQGWQSWSATGAYRLGDRQHTSILGPFQNPMVVNPGTPQPKGKNRFSGDMFGLLGDLTSQQALLAGFLSQKAHFGSLLARFHPAPDLQVWANGDETISPPGGEVTTDWLLLGFTSLAVPDPLSAYLTTVAQHHHIQSETEIPVGWCSWYHFYQDIDQRSMNANLDAVMALKPELPLPLFQIDDGFETYPGDWYDFKAGFQQGLRPIAAKTKAAGLTPGVWLAPFIVHPKARLVQAHPDWLLRDAQGKPVNAGFVWNQFTYALDLTHPEALAYACDVVRTAVQEWGFTYLKLDFLYAAALKGVYQDPCQSRAQVLRKGLTALREAAGPEVALLGCGCPLGSALGVFDAMRISADVSGHWGPNFPPVSPVLQKEPHMPSARNAIHNVLTRAQLHQRWWVNDPDCLLIRPDTQLTLDEVQSLATLIGMTGGSLLVSDDLPQLPADRLRLARVLLPVIGQRAQVLDLFEDNFPSRLRLDLKGPTGPWRLLAWHNWEDQPQDLNFTPGKFGLPDEKPWWLHEFWTGATSQMSSGRASVFSKVPPHGVRVVAARPFDPNRPTYLGSDLHLSQGLELGRWEPSGAGLEMSFNLGRLAAGEISLFLPWRPEEARFKGRTLPLNDLGLGVYSLKLQENLDGEALLILQGTS